MSVFDDGQYETENGVQEEIEDFIADHDLEEFLLSILEPLEDAGCHSFDLDLSSGFGVEFLVLTCMCDLPDMDRVEQLERALYGKLFADKSAEHKDKIHFTLE